MFSGLHRVIIVIALVALVSGTTGCAYLTGLPFEQGPLPTGQITVDPPFATVGERSELRVTLEVTDADLDFLADKLTLERQQSLTNGSTVFAPIARLRDDGQQGDARVGDRIFSGVVAFDEPVTGSIKLRAVGQAVAFKEQILVSPKFLVPARLACGPTGNVLPVTIFAVSQGKDDSETVQFDVPKGGEAVLRLVNGARIGASIGERVAQARISLNGKRVDTVGKGTNVAEAPVDLKPGTNVLKVDKRVVKPGQRLSARIDACADAIALEPVLNAIVAGEETVPAQAKVTALGLPVADAKVTFAIEGLGDAPAARASTDRAGTARASLGPSAKTGPGDLTATLEGSAPPLGAATGIEVVTQARLTVEQRPQALRLETGAGRAVRVDIGVREVEGRGNRVTLRHVIKPEPGGDAKGVTVESDFAGEDVDVPKTFGVSVAVTGVTPGNYRVLSTATNEKTGASATDALRVEVITPDTLMLSQPTLEPGAVNEQTPSPVTFRARASGIDQLPASLTLQRCEPEAEACGPEPDAEGWSDIDGFPLVPRGDGVYTRTVPIAEPAEGEVLYRVSASHRGETVLSRPETLRVLPIRFPPGLDPAPVEFIEYSGPQARFVAERVLAKYLPGTSSDDIEAIAEGAVRRALERVLGAVPPGEEGRVSRITGFLPVGSIFQVGVLLDPGRLSDDERARIVTLTVDELESHDQVRLAQPDFEYELAQITVNCTAGGGPGWGRSQIGTDDALAAISSLALTWEDVAVIDTGVKGDHTDFAAAQIQGDDTDTVGHGTAVAGVIGGLADADDTVNGVAPGVAMQSEKRASDNTSGYSSAINSVVNTLSAKIINLSWKTISTDPFFECAIERAVYPDGEGFTSSCGDAEEGKGILMIAAAGNSGLEIQACNILTDPTCGLGGTKVPSYPCLWDDLVVCVAGTKSDDTRHSAASNMPSNYGPAVDISAPGVDIYTTSSSGDFQTCTGTSLAAPHVAGAAAVVWPLMEVMHEAGDPEVTAEVVRDVLLQNAALMPAEPLFTAPVGGVKQGMMGFGRLDLYNAVVAVLAVPLVYLEEWNQSGDLAGWTPNTTQTSVSVVDTGGNPQGYLSSSGTVSGSFDIGANTGLADVTGDFRGDIWRVSFDVRFISGNFDNLWLRFRYKDATENGWLYPFATTFPVGAWSSFTVTFDPDWTDAQARAAGWRTDRDEGGPTVSPSQSWSVTMSDVFSTEVRISGEGALQAGIDNFRLERVP